jgi:GrpB-like predicted nucleotidyltransferase (UPF0157 family)
MSAKKEIVIEDYNPQWPLIFQGLKQGIWPNISDVASAIEHVGSTAVPGLKAKPIIDLDIVINASDVLPVIISRLEKLGYKHAGNQGIEGREAFDNPPGLPKHHLYVCLVSAAAFKNHILLRDYLRQHPEAVKQYGELKTRLAEKYKNDIDRYCEDKTAFITDILAKQGIHQSDLDGIRSQNTSRPQSPGI